MLARRAQQAGLSAQKQESKTTMQNTKAAKLHITLTGEAIAGGATKLTVEQAQALGLSADNPEVQGKLKTFGPWQLPVSYSALCTSIDYTPKDRAKYSAQYDAMHLYGPRTMSDMHESGYAQEGRVSIKGKKVRAFTSSNLFQLPCGTLVNVATVHACI